MIVGKGVQGDPPIQPIGAELTIEGIGDLEVVPVHVA